MSPLGTGTRLLSLPELAKLVPWSEAVLRTMIRRGELPAQRIGHRIFVRESEVTRVLGSLPAA